MKRWKKMLVSLLTVCLFSSLSVISALAADGDEYTYTVTLSAGSKGTINGAEKDVTANLQKGSRVTLNINDVQVTDSKYYVKGFRLSGRDNEEALAAPAFTVTSDVDYVVAYGIKGNMVAYTVSYLDANGNELAPSSTFYGNVGDKPVVAYRYIENYAPQALALTKTLSANETENVFAFTYTPGEAGTIVETTTTTTVVAGTATTGGAAAGTAGTAGAAGTGTAGEAGEPAGADAAVNPDGEGTVENPDEDTPQGLVDLDDEETPKSNIDASEKETSKKGPIAAGIAIIAISVAALIALIVFLKKRAK